MLGKFKRIIQIELNELSEDLVRKCAAQGILPNFSKVLETWQQTNTVSETEYEKLEPWIQWVTAHTGKTFDEHQIFHLGDGGNLKYDQLWEKLSDSNLESAIIGCMNAVRGRAKGGIFFPDPWTKNGEAYPPKLQDTWDFVRSRVQNHALEGVRGSSLPSGLKTLFSMRFKPAFYMRIGAQIIRQKLNPSKKWALAGLFDEFLFNFFDEILSETNFSFYSLFLNSMAHYQHHYWRQHERNLFNPEISCPDCGVDDDPITYGLLLYDRMLGTILKKYSADPTTLVLICTGLSQTPYCQDEARGGMNYFRLKNHREFAKRLGLQNVAIFPMMSRDWQIASASPEALERAYIKLAALTVGEQKLFKISKNGDGSYFIETAIIHAIDKGREILDHDGLPIGKFLEDFASIAVKSGCHASRGSLWCSQPVLSEEQIPEVSLTQLAKITLDNFGISNDSATTSETPTFSGA